MVFIKLLIFLGMFIAISTFLIYGAMNPKEKKRSENVWVTQAKTWWKNIVKFFKEKKWRK